MVVPVLAVISAGNNLVGCQHIALPGVQPGAFLQLRPGIHLHVVVGVGPGDAGQAAGAGLGAALGGNLLIGSDIRAARHIPGAGKGRSVCRLCIHSNGSRCAYREKAAGIAVCKTFGGIAAACVNFQIL